MGKKKFPTVKFEIINAGRTGIDSPSIAAIVKDEVIPLQPDFVVYYEGSNQFLPAYYVKFPTGNAPEKPVTTFRPPSPLESYSAILIRVLQAIDIISGGNGAEPKKPNLSVEWPIDLDEFDPDPTYTELPLQLDTITSNLKSINQDLRKFNSELVISSFVLLAFDGMKLDLEKNPGIYKYLNETYWPYSYKHIRRMQDFQNRVFYNFALKNNIEFIDVAKYYPQIPSLFRDPIHMTSLGVRLHAWIALHELIPIIQRKIELGKLPSNNINIEGTYPPFEFTKNHLINRSAIMKECTQK